MKWKHHNVIPSSEERQRFADAIQQAVREVDRVGNGYRQCHFISAATCIVLNALSPPSNEEGVKYRVHVGRVDMLFSRQLKRFIFSGEDRLSVGRQSLDSPDIAYKWVEHTWVERDWELADFSTYFYKDYFREQYGVDWSFSSQYFWGWKSKVPDSLLTYWYVTDEYWTRTMLQNFYGLPVWRETIISIVEKALLTLEPQGYSRPADDQLWPEWMRKRLPDMDMARPTSDSDYRPWRLPRPLF